MSSRPQTPSTAVYGSVPGVSDSHVDRGYGTGSRTNITTTGVADFAQGNPQEVSPISQSYTRSVAELNNYNDIQREASLRNEGQGLNRSASTASTAVHREATPSRSNTLKKKGSVSRRTSLKHSTSRKSLRSMKGGYPDGVDQENYHYALYTPIPTSGSPTDILANRFQAWRQLLKQLITYFREVQTSYEHRAKALMKVSNVISNTSHPSVFITDGGLADATRILSDYHKHSLAEANKSRDIEADVIAALTGLRSDLGQKIKEIKSLSGDFKNTVDREKEGTRKAIDALAEALQHVDHDAGDEKGRHDPFIVRLGVERQIERQIDEENYLHRAYLNLETSGRELESIVVGEIQKAYNALASILKREGDDAYGTVESLRTGPIAMPKDSEWMSFVSTDPHFVNPKLPLRRIEDIEYSGKHHPAAAEVRAGMLERKSKYLKSYTPGWYVLSPTHLHEFKSADKIFSQPPVMSLYLPDQKLGSHSGPESSSHKFMLKGRQAGGMHRGHSWVFRAESYDTMMAWYEAIKNLTEKTGEERNAFVRQHARSVSGNSHRASISSDGMEEDEADQVPYSAQSSVVAQPIEQTREERPAPGGRFPSDLQVPRERPLSPSSGSSEPDREVIAAAGALPGTGVPFPGNNMGEPTPRLEKYETNPYELRGIDAGEDASLAASAGVGAAAVAAHERNRERSEIEGLQVVETPMEQERQRRVEQVVQTPVVQTPMEQERERRVEQVVETPVAQTPMEQERERRMESPQPVNEQSRTAGAYGMESPQPTHEQTTIMQTYQPITDQRNTWTDRQPTTEPDRSVESYQPTTEPDRSLESYQPTAAPANTMYATTTASRLDPRNEPEPETARDTGDIVETQTYALPILQRDVSHQMQPEPTVTSPLQQTPRPAEPIRHESVYGDWMAPAAAGTATGIIGSEAYHRSQDPTITGETFENPRTPPEPPTPAQVNNTIAYNATKDYVDTSSGSGPSEASASTVPTSITGSGMAEAGNGLDGLGGLEKDGAAPTGRIFPVVRHNTDMSVSQLHVPGEYGQSP